MNKPYNNSRKEIYVVTRICELIPNNIFISLFVSLTVLQRKQMSSFDINKKHRFCFLDQHNFNTLT